MKKVAILGGTFDPPHVGHLLMATNVLRANLADEVWLMVSPRNPLKTERRLTPEDARLEMCRLAVADVPGVVASDFEFSLPRPSFSARTLRELAKEYPDVEFSMIVGADNWLAFSRWRDPEEILENFGLIVCPRPGDVVDGDFEPLDPMPGGWRSRVMILRDAPSILLSSTEIRNLASRGKNLMPLVDPRVDKYIKDNNLYI